MLDYRLLFREENQAVEERYTLSMERIHQIKNEAETAAAYREFFERTADFSIKIGNLYEKIQSQKLQEYSMEQLQKLNYSLYEDIIGDNYSVSYANPQFAAASLGVDYGKILSMLYSEMRGSIVYAYECRLEEITVFNELFIEIYNCFENENLPDLEEISEIMYWFFSDYSDRFIEYRIREQLDTGLSFARDIIMEADLSDLRYLYSFGEYITDNELRVAAYLNSLPQEQIDLMATTFTEGYRMGFEASGKDLSKKRIVNIRYHLGFERIIKSAIKNFEKLGLYPAIYRRSVSSLHSRIGYEGGSANKQYEYDHKEDKSLYTDKAYVERRLGILKSVYEEYRIQAAAFSGPACMEVFGEKAFIPETKPECLKLDEKQQGLQVKLANASAQIVNEYIPGDERSFTIIAFPLPEIGQEFESIFSEVIKINTLDYKLYQGIQQKIIDALDKGEYVHIKGMGENLTDIKVWLHSLTDPQKQTIFENCVADVNIPVGEVFTSPRLAGTNGLLHVTSVYLNELEYRQLKLVFRDGMIEEYSCENFSTEEENKRYIKDNVLYHHDTLPMGEFAIGTNTTAYVVADRYKIADRLPVLIAEKMGPHFAVGDTCYSWEEDVAVYNPDGKEIIARENEVSIRRKENISEAYFNCHTDITIPYDELGSIEVVSGDGSRITIVQNGRFVLAGTEPLNEPFLAELKNSGLAIDTAGLN